MEAKKPKTKRKAARKSTKTANHEPHKAIGEHEGHAGKAKRKK